MLRPAAGAEEVRLLECLSPLGLARPAEFCRHQCLPSDAELLREEEPARVPARVPEVVLAAAYKAAAATSGRSIDSPVVSCTHFRRDRCPDGPAVY